MKKLITVIVTLFALLQLTSVCCSACTTIEVYGTWIIDENVKNNDNFIESCPIVSNNTLYYQFIKNGTFVYLSNDSGDTTAYCRQHWENGNYRTVTLLAKPSHTFEIWLNKYAKKIEDKEPIASTWELKQTLNNNDTLIIDNNFIYNGKTFSRFSKNGTKTYYENRTSTIEAYSNDAWAEEGFRKITFFGELDETELTWLNNNAKECDEQFNFTYHTWKLNDTIKPTKNVSFNAVFISNDNFYNQIYYYDNSNLLYINDELSIDAFIENKWKSQNYRTVAFVAEPQGDLLVWLNENGKELDPIQNVQAASVIADTSPFPFGVFTGIGISTVIFCIVGILLKRKPQDEDK